ncbi:MAG TPA: glycosyltransferase family 39 protein [Thermomicrobiales bacterium]|nr:glycosyltransferase family 39 protein [Thermomicrobiales bacterium]
MPPPATAADVLWLMVAILLSLALRIPFFKIPMIHDEGGYAYAARGWIEGTGRLYDDLWISRPQGIFVLYGLVFRFLGEGVLALRFTAWIFVALTVLAVWFFARRWAATRTANLAAAITAVVLALPNLEGFTANAEIFMGLPIAFAAFWLVRQAQLRWSMWQLCGVGVLIGLATVLKPSGIVMAFTALAFIAMVGEDVSLQQRLHRCGAVLGGMALVGIVTLAHGWYLGWSAFIYATVTYRLTLQSSATVSAMRHLISLGRLAWTIVALLSLVYVIFAFRTHISVCPPAHLQGAAGSWQLKETVPDRPGHLRLFITSRRSLNDGETASLMIQLWSIGAIAGIAMGGDWWSHYLLQIAPPFALWLAWNLERIVGVLRHWQRWLFVAIASGLLLLPYEILVDGPEELLNDHPGYPAQAEVSRYIQEHSDPQDRIYVAFDQAAIYYLSDRKPAYRHLYDQELRALPNSYADIIEVIRGDDRPLYIVSTLHPGPFPDDSRTFWREVGQYYEIETTIGGVPIYRAKDAP